MTQPPYRIAPSIWCPRYVPLTGWRRLVHRFTGWPFARARYVWFENHTFYCHPDTVPVVKRFLDSRGAQYVQESARLAEVPRV